MTHYSIVEAILLQILSFQSSHWSNKALCDLCSTQEYSAVKYNAVQGFAVQCSIVKCSTLQCSTLQCTAVHCSAVHCTVYLLFEYVCSVQSVPTVDKSIECPDQKCWHLLKERCDDQRNIKMVLPLSFFQNMTKQ